MRRKLTFLQIAGLVLGAVPPPCSPKIFPLPDKNSSHDSLQKKLDALAKAEQKRQRKMKRRMKL